MSKTPKLRFNEFIGEWESMKLGTVGEFFKGSTLSKANLTEEGKSCILYGELYTRYGEVIKNVISKTNLDDPNLIIGQKNDVLIPSSGETAIDIATASCLQKDNVILGGDLNVFRSKKLNGIFASYQLNNSKRREIAKLAQGASVVHVYNTQLSKLKLSVPSKEEQDKIACFFSLIDDKISLQVEKVESLKDYKKGMIQKIFGRELRFKDDEGRDYPEWKVNKLKFILKEVSEKTKENNQHEVISSTTNGLFLQKEYFNREIASSDNTGYKIIRLNQVVLSPQNLWMGNINFNDKYNIGIVSPSYKIFDINDNFDDKYIGYILRTQRAFYEFMQSSEQGASIVRRNLNMDLFNEISFDIPCKEEQVKISKFIGSIDLKIEKEQSKVDSLNEYKKGLLQQMFV